MSPNTSNIIKRSFLTVVKIVENFYSFKIKNYFFIMLAQRNGKDAQYVSLVKTKWRSPVCSARESVFSYRYRASRFIKVYSDRYLEFLYPLKTQSSGVQEMNA